MQDGDSLVDFFSRAGEESGFPDLTEIRSRVGSALQLQQSPVRSVLDITGCRRPSSSIRLPTSSASSGSLRRIPSIRRTSIFPPASRCGITLSRSR